MFDGIEIMPGLIVKGGLVVEKSTPIETILDRATEVIGSRAKAFEWMGTPIAALNYATPISLLADDPGTDQVLAVLAKLEHGVL